MLKKISLTLFFAVLLLASCNKEKSLQEYYIDKQDSPNFMFIDVPGSIITLKDDAPADVKQTLESVKKLNLMIFKIDEKNKADYQKEKAELKNILQNKRYQDLIRLNHKGARVVAKYSGEIDAIDEMILYASDDGKGFAVARLIGDHIQPQHIIKLLKNIDDIDKDNPIFSQLKSMAEEVK